MTLFKDRITGRVLLLAVAAIVATVSIAVVASILSDGNGDTKPVAVVSANGINVFAVGHGVLSAGVSQSLSDRGAAVESSNDISSLPDGTGAVTVFDGAWFAANRDTAELRSYLGRSVSSGSRVVIIGDQTSVLYEVLDQLGIMRLAIDESGNLRNPAYMNPPQVGFMIKGQGDESWPSHLASLSDNPDVLATALINWN